jgi:hypothetical protein
MSRANITFFALGGLSKASFMESFFHKVLFALRDK